MRDTFIKWDDSEEVRCPSCHSTNIIELGKCWLIPEAEVAYGCKNCRTLFGPVEDLRIGNGS